MVLLTKLLYNLLLIYFGSMLLCELIDSRGGKFILYGNYVIFYIYINNMYIFFLGLEGVLIVLIYRDLWED